jgi:hypothetical protein
MSTVTSFAEFVAEEIVGVEPEALVKVQSEAVSQAKVMLETCPEVLEV